MLDQASKIATSNTSCIFSKDLFASTFASALGVDDISTADLNVLLTHLSRDRCAISYSEATGTVKIKAPSEPLPTPISDEDISIARLRTLISSLQPQIDQLSTQVAALDRKSREAVTVNQLTTAKASLRSKKLAETKLQRRNATLASLEEVYSKIEQASDQVEIVRVMEASSQTLRSLNKQTGGVEKVQDVVDGLRDEMMNADEIGQALNEASTGDVDEGEVDAELEALESVEREKRQAEEQSVKEQKDEEERKVREQKEAEEAEETRKKLAQLDEMVGAGTPAAETKPEGGQKEKDEVEASQLERAS